MTLDLHAIYRDLHQHPELSFAEHRTAGIVADHLQALGFDVTTGIAGTGVVGVLRNGDGPTVLLRADMDGLPVLEDTGLDYASRMRGVDPHGEDVPVMHACGHDVHVTCLLGAAERLANEQSGWRGTLIALFQLAEERDGGAQAMIDDGLYERIPTPDVVLGQHVGPLAAGTVVVHEGPAMAAVDSMRVTVFGRGGHGSRPQDTVDPIVLAASIVLRLQTIVAREVNPFETAVVTVGALHAGTKSNIIPAEARLDISIRSFDPVVRERVLAAVRRIVEAECVASGSPREPEYEFGEAYPVTVNDPDATQRTRAALAAVFGDANVGDPGPISGSEDVGVLATAAGAPLVYWFLGGFDPAEASVPIGRFDPAYPANHSPFFAPVIEPTISTGVTALVTAAREWLD